MWDCHQRRHSFWFWKKLSGVHKERRENIEEKNMIGEEKKSNMSATDIFGGFENREKYKFHS